MNLFQIAATFVIVLVLCGAFLHFWPRLKPFLAARFGSRLSAELDRESKDVDAFMERLEPVLKDLERNVMTRVNTAIMLIKTTNPAPVASSTATTPPLVGTQPTGPATPAGDSAASSTGGGTDIDAVHAALNAEIMTAQAKIDAAMQKKKAIDDAKAALERAMREFSGG